MNAILLVNLLRQGILQGCEVISNYFYNIFIFFSRLQHVRTIYIIMSVGIKQSTWASEKENR